MKPQISIPLNLFLLLALSACGRATPMPSRLPDPEEGKPSLIQQVEVEKRAPGIVLGMIAADPQERWVASTRGYGGFALSLTSVNLVIGL